jgi:hypothetical protein
MKMKTLYKYIGIVTALLAIGPAASAQYRLQRAADNGNKVEGLELAKKVDQNPDENGVRWIELESYVTGAVTVKKVAKPADIVLVLDVSGSMDGDMYTYRYSARNQQSYTNSGYYGFTERPYYNYYFKHTDDKYYPVYLVEHNSYYRYHLKYTADGIDYYLSGTSTTTTEPEWVDYGETIWTGVLYTRSATRTGETKMEALRNSVKEFVKVIYENDIYETDENGKIVVDAQGNKVRRTDEKGAYTTLGNKISIVKFANDEYWSSLNYIPSEEDGIQNHKNAGSDGGHTNRRSSYNYSEVVIPFTSPTTSDFGINTTLRDLIDGIDEGGGTASNYGLNKAERLFNSIKESRPNSTKTVVLFTDGKPGMNTAGSFDVNFANPAINIANTIKNTYDAKVFTIGVFSDLGNEASLVDKYMNYISSNYTGKQSMTDQGTKTGSGFYQDASGNDLSAIFKSVAEQSGGDGSSLGEDSIVEIDVVSSSFNVPLPHFVQGKDYSIQILTQKCNGYDAQGKGNSFETTRTLLQSVQNNMTNVDGTTSTVAFDADELANNIVSIDGFDFAKNFCGRRTDDAHKTDTNPEGYYADGYKLIVRIPIVVNEDAVGGAATKTNDPKSGIYADGVLQGKFPEPDIDIPVNLWVKKYGLEKGESAKFKIQRKPINGGNWEDYTTIIITGTGEIVEDENDNYNGYLTSPVYKLNGLNNRYYYQVIEEGWSWSYNNHPDTDVTTETLTKNPVIFVNEKSKTSPKHAESKAINEFGEGYNAKMVDSRGYLK